MLSLLCVLLILLVMGFWAFQGLYSAVIMFGLALIALLLGLSFYEPLAATFQESIKPELAGRIGRLQEIVQVDLM